LKFSEHKINITIIIINFISLLIFLALLIFIPCFYKNNIPIFIFLISIALFLIYFGFTLFSLFNFKKLNLSLQSLEEVKLHNKTLQILYDDVRTFKHDFCNIVQSIDGYIKTGNLPSLEKYNNEIKLECNSMNSLSALNPKFIDDSGIYNLIASKYYKAKKFGISLDMNFLVKFSSLNASTYALSRVLRNSFR